MDEKIFESNLSGSSRVDYVRGIHEGKSVLISKTQLLSELGITQAISRIDAEMANLRTLVNDVVDKIVITDEETYRKLEEEGKVDPNKIYMRYEDD